MDAHTPTVESRESSSVASFGSDPGTYAADPDRPRRIYVERVGDDRLLRVAQTLDGIEISGMPA